MSKPTVIRPMFGVGLWCAVAAMSAIAIGSLLFAEDPLRRAGAILVLPILCLGLGWVLLVAPKVTMDDEAITIDNPLRRVRVPRGRVEGIETHRGFRVVTDEGKIDAWAAPSPSRLDAVRIAGSRGAESLMKDPRVHRELDGGLRTSSAPGTLSGDAAMSARHHGHLDASEAEPRRAIERSWIWPNVALAIASPLAALAAALLPG